MIEQAGGRIGHYKLLEKIGEGGYGVVYMAEQAEPIRRRVALKVVKLGMDTKQVIARFEAERQALALMDHPNIAKVLDAGSTETGRPYFVMELVRGIKITDYCDQQNLSTKERLDLFIQVCHAVQHAHQKGIIHRDLKPSNVLVTELDGLPVPKVIDFGIAKATGQQLLTDKTLFTAFQHFVGTPAYMSPEQARMSGADVDTRSDIYTLGVLLYELLTGHVPFEKKEFLQAGFDEMRRVIREKEPPKPSTRLSSLSADDLTTVAKRRHAEPPRLIHLIRGDLDWIVMKCLEKDRGRRYETASGLAHDLARHLNSEPVTAAAPGPAYRIGKFIRRHRYGFATASAIVLLLIAGVVVSTWQMMRARGAEHQARTVAMFLKDTLEGLSPAVDLGRDTNLVRQIVDATENRITKDLTKQPEVAAEVRHALGTVYEALGDYEKAEKALREALAMRRKLLGDQHAAVADSLNDLGAVLHGQGRLAEAEAMLREAVAMRKRLPGNPGPGMAESLNNLGMVLLWQGKLAEAESVQREAVAMQTKLVSEDNPTVARYLGNLGAVLNYQGRLPEAETVHRRALAIQRRLLNKEHPYIATALNNLAEVLQKQAKLAEAEETFRQVVVMRRKLLGNEHPALAVSLNNLAGVLQEEGNLAEAEALQHEALAIYRKLLRNDHPSIATSLVNLAGILQQQNKLVEAEAMYREALVIFRKQMGHEHPHIAAALDNLAGVLQQEGKVAEAEALARESLTMRRKLLGNEDASVAFSLSSLAVLLRQRGSLVEAEALNRECLIIAEKNFPDDWRTFDARSRLGSTLLAQQRYAEAEPLLLAGYDGLKQREDRIPADRKRLLEGAVQQLVQLYQATAQPDKSAEWKKRLAELTNRPPATNSAAEAKGR
jgi:tetratricopeptide (TPR) repeat protein